MRRRNLLIGAAVCLILALLDWFEGIAAAPTIATTNGQGVCDEYLNGSYVGTFPCNTSGSGIVLYVGVFVPLLILALTCLISSVLPPDEAAKVQIAAGFTIFLVPIAGLIGIVAGLYDMVSVVLVMAGTASVLWPLIYLVLALLIKLRRRPSYTPPSAARFFKGLLASIFGMICIATFGEFFLVHVLRFSSQTFAYTALISFFWMIGLIFGILLRKLHWWFILCYCGAALALTILLTMK